MATPTSMLAGWAATGRPTPPPGRGRRTSAPRRTLEVAAAEVAEVPSAVAEAVPAVAVAPAVPIAVAPAVSVTVSIPVTAEDVIDQALAEAQPGAEGRAHQQRLKQPAAKPVEVSARPGPVLSRSIPVVGGTAVDLHLAAVGLKALLDPQCVGRASGNGTGRAARWRPLDVLG